LKRIPSVIHLGLYDVRVVMLTKKAMRVEADCDEGDITPEGMWVDEDDTIYLGRWLSSKRKREVLFHELTHAVLDYREHVGECHETLT
jgi:Zn-dependent peptidase ImmA (M78 family)